MKKILLISILLIGLQSKAQGLIAVQNGGSPAFYQSLPIAIQNAVQNDTIYIPGGSFDSFILDKKLHLVGVGHNPDSSVATNISQINDEIVITNIASGSSFTGLKICSLKFGSSVDNENINNVKVDRCWLGNCELGIQNNSTVNNVFFINNIIQSLNGYFSRNSVFNNNIIGRASSFKFAIFKNNIFLGGIDACNFGGSGSCISSITSSTLENNIFFNSAYNLDFCILNNNILNGSIHSTITDDCIFQNNITNQSQNSIFTDQAIQNLIFFSYGFNYNLNPISQGVNEGKDGTDIGVYGGAFPWKEGSMPFNPHIETQTVSPTTDGIGNLNINMTIKAQDH